MFRSVILVFLVVVLSGSVESAVGQAVSEGPPMDKSQASSLDADPHLVGWWRLEENSGRTAADASKHGRHGTLRGGLAFEKRSVAGRVGRALALHGKDGLVEIVGYQGVTGTRVRTVAAWIKTAEDEGQIVVWGADDFGKLWEFGFIRGHLGVAPGGGYLYINDRINDDRWHHVAAVVDGGDPPNLHDNVKLYVDGLQPAIHDIGLLDLWPVDTGREMNVTIGRRFNGLIDEVRLYDRALRDDEVMVLFQQSSNTKR